jgi:hypothetical protein
LLFPQFCFDFNFLLPFRTNILSNFLPRESGLTSSAYSNYKLAYVRHLNTRAAESEQQFHFIEFSISKERCGIIIPFFASSDVTGVCFVDFFNVLVLISCI